MRTAFLVALTGLLTGCAATPATTYDVLITGATVYDGSLAAGARQDVAVLDGRITLLRPHSKASATRTIDARGLYVVPGFIDPHTHATGDLLNPATNSNINYLTQGVTTVLVGNDGGGLPQADVSIATMKSQGIGSNVAYFAGHGSLRQQVMGKQDRAPTPAELERIKALLGTEMQRGAVGLSTGLYYVPGNYAATDELIALAGVAESYGGIYDTHLRDESSYNIGLQAAVAEAIEIARQSGIAVHISHIKALGKDVWGQSADIIAMIDAARAAGLAVSANQYPWRASGTRFTGALLPRWVLADSDARMLARLEDPELAAAIRDEMYANMARRGGADAMLVTAADSQWQGMTLADIATALQLDPVAAAVQVIRAGNPSIASFNMSPDDIARFAVQVWVMTGSDGSSGHPRKYATYPKAWQDLVATGRLSVEQFVHRSSGLVAETLHLCDRGYLRDGYAADIAVLDPQHFAANADYENPTVLSSGIRYLLVNGAMVVDNDNYNGALHGQVLARGNCVAQAE